MLVATVVPTLGAAGALAQETGGPRAEGAGAPTAVELAAALPDAWQGPCDLVVLATDEEGQPVGGVQVSLRLGDAPSVLRGLVTDAEGRAAISGLAAGEWQVELRRDGFMLYTAYLKLEAGRAPELGFRSRQRTGSFWAPLEAVFLGAEELVTPAVRAGRVSPGEAEKELERARRREERAERREARRVEQGRAARLVEPEQPAEEVAGREERAAAGESEADRPTRAVPLPAAPAPAAPSSSAARAESPEAGVEREPARASTPESPADRPARSGTGERSADQPARSTPAERPADRPARSAPEPDPPRPDAPLPASRDAAPAGPRLLPNPDLLPAGACPECRPGEWSVAAQATAAPAGSCASTPPGAALEPVISALAEHLVGPLAGYAGTLWAADGNDALRLLPDAVDGELRAVLEPLMGGASSCPVVALVIPDGARYVGFRYAAGQRSGMAECPPGQGCLIGQASWLGNPEIVPAGGSKVVWARFENASPQRERTPRLTVYFDPARGWLPPPSR